MDGSLLSPASPLLNALTPRCGHRKLSAKDTDDCGRCHVVGARRRSQLDKWGRLRRRKRSKHVNTAAVGVLGAIRVPFWEGVQRALRKVSQPRGAGPEGAQGAPGAKDLVWPSGVPSAGSTRVGGVPACQLHALCPGSLGQTL